MTVTNSFTSGTTIQSSAVNANFSDIASEITGSLPRDGQAAMTGQMKAASGTAAAPGVTFGSDTDTGFYRKAANTIGVACGGIEVASIDATGFSVFPSGTAMLFVQTSAPTGWTKSTSHNDKALRVVSGTASTGGSTAFSSVFAARTISIENLPAAELYVGNITVQVASTSTSIGSNGVGNGNWGTGGGSATVQSLSSGSGTLQTITPTITSTATVLGHVPLGGSGTAVDFAVQYVDTIIATKD